jgi:hypothetical protein
VDVAVSSNGRILVAGADQDYAETSTRAFVASWASATAIPVVTQLAVGNEMATAEAKSVAFSPNQQGYVLWRDSSSTPTQSFIAAITNGVPGSSVVLGSDPIYGLAVDGTETLYTTRYTPSGSVLVKATLAGISSLVPISRSGWVGLDAANNVYVAGETYDVSATSRLYVQSLGPQGQTRYAWSSVLLNGDSQVFDAAVDPDGGLVLVGMTNADAFPRVGGVGVPRTNDRYSAFILQLTPSGTSIAYSDLFNATTTWNRGTQFAAITIDAAGNAAIAGSVIDESNEWVSGLLTRVQIQDLPTPPPHTRSYYIQSRNLQLATQSGCDARRNGEQGIVVLAFGRPASVTQQNGTVVPGVRLVNAASPYITLDVVEDILLAFAVGYSVPNANWRGYQCTNSSAASPLSITLVAGLSNSAFGISETEWYDNANLTDQHGRLWSQMINRVDEKFRRPLVVNGTTIRLTPKVRIAAGYDAEAYQSQDNRETQRIPAPNEHGNWEWSTYEPTRTWLEGYTHYQEENRTFKTMYIFGSCESCPRLGTPDQWVQDTAQDGKKQVLDRVVYVNWKVSATVYPLPQIYHTPYPYEWYNVRWYGHSRPAPEHAPIQFGQVMTQCDDSACIIPAKSIPPSAIPRLSPLFSCDTQGAPCVGSDWQPFLCTASQCSDFTPSAGWQALDDTLRNPNLGAVELYRKPPQYITDICQQIRSCDQGQS